jgi:hypothetical protein
MISVSKKEREVTSMAEPATNHKQEVTTTKPHTEKEESLKGTFASVMLLGGFLAVTWLFVFILFLVRN